MLLVNLPVEADGELDLATRMCRLHFAEVWVRVEAIDTGLADRVVVVGAIEQVVELGAEGQHTAFTEELEALLNSEEETPIQILPNGEIREIGKATSAEMGKKKPLTMRENLGGEY